ncbi:hypothetical protein ABT299_06395 [Spirillospora sp. NPDC000708]
MSVGSRQSADVGCPAFTAFVVYRVAIGALLFGLLAVGHLDG